MTLTPHVLFLRIVGARRGEFSSFPVGSHEGSPLLGDPTPFSFSRGSNYLWALAPSFFPAVAHRWMSFIPPARSRLRSEGSGSILRSPSWWWWRLGRRRRQGGVVDRKGPGISPERAGRAVGRTAMEGGAPPILARPRTRTVRRVRRVGGALSSMGGRPLPYCSLARMSWIVEK